MAGDFLIDDFDTMMNTDEFAIEVTFTPYVGYTLTLNAIFDIGREVIDPYTGEKVNIKPVLYCKADDVPGIRHKSKFLIDSVYYDVLTYDNNLGEMVINLQREAV